MLNGKYFCFLAMHAYLRYAQCHIACNQHVKEYYLWGQETSLRQHFFASGDRVVDYSIDIRELSDAGL